MLLLAIFTLCSGRFMITTKQRGSILAWDPTIVLSLSRYRRVSAGNLVNIRL